MKVGAYGAASAEEHAARRKLKEKTKTKNSLEHFSQSAMLSVSF
jgi:hypothetical protein